MLRDKKRTALFAVSLAGQVIFLSYLYSLPERYISVDLSGSGFYSRQFNGKMSPADWQASNRATSISIFISISIILNLVIVACVFNVNPFDSNLQINYWITEDLKPFSLFFLLNTFVMYFIACAPGMVLVKHKYINVTYIFLTFFAFFFFLLLFFLIYDASRLYDFLRVIELSAVIACFVCAAYYYNNSFVSVLIFNFIAFLGLSHLITTCVKSYRPYSYIGYYLLSAAYLTLVNVLLNCHSMDFAHSHTMQHVLTVLGIFLLCSYVCGATLSLFECYNIKLINAGFKKIYPFACLFVAISSLYINYNVAKNATAEILCYVTFALSSVFCMFFAYRLAQYMLFRSDKNIGSGGAASRNEQAPDLSDDGVELDQAGESPIAVAP